MIIRQVRENRWNYLLHQIAKYGRHTPLSLQVDLDISFNGTDYILKVQPGHNRKIAILQALSVSSDGFGIGGKEYCLIENDNLLSALFELVLYQGLKKRPA